MRGIVSYLLPIKVEHGAVTLTRTGSISSKLVFEKDKSTKTIYTTQFGDFDMTIDTREVAVDKNSEGTYSLYMKYSISILGLGSTVNELSLSFRN
jgi:uncharacterized beta-barrel protein YwiB (DUF1934 family)